MTPELYTYLKDCWVKSNHTKYRYYFEEWVDKITQSQIEGFSRMMIKGNVYTK